MRDFQRNLKNKIQKNEGIQVSCIWKGFPNAEIINRKCSHFVQQRYRDHLKSSLRGKNKEYT